MKNIFQNRKVKFASLLFLLFLFVLPLQSCVVHERTHTTTYRKSPPGHQKKYRGDRSARNYAPGHQKNKQHKNKKGGKNKGNHNDEGRGGRR